MKDLTYLIKTFNRPKCCESIVSQIREQDEVNPIVVIDDGNRNPNLPNTVNHIITEFDIGLAEGRNVGLTHCDTKYTILMDDDFDLSSKLSLLYDGIVKSDADIVAGTVGRPKGKSYWIGTLEKTEKSIKIKQHPKGIDTATGFPIFDIVQNFFIAKTDFLKSVLWNAEYKIGAEHMDFFMRAMEKNPKILLHPKSIAFNKHINNPNYKKYKQRYTAFLSKFFRNNDLETIKVENVQKKNHVVISNDNGAAAWGQEPLDRWPETKFIILTHQRSGSTLLSNAINDMNWAVCGGEILHKRPGHRKLHYKRLFNSKTMHPITVNPHSSLYKPHFLDYYFYDYFWALPAAARPHAAGFKFFINHIEDIDISDHIANDPTIKIIRLKRENPIYSLVSFLAADKTNNWFNDTQLGTVQVSSQQVIEANDALKKQDEFVDKYRDTHEILNLTYKDLCLDYEKSILKVSAFLKLPHEVPEQSLKKQDKRLLQNKIRNYNQLKTSLNGRPEAEFLVDKEF